MRSLLKESKKLFEELRNTRIDVYPRGPSKESANEMAPRVSARLSKDARPSEEQINRRFTI